MARLNSAYGYLGQGQVTVSTPAGAANITYQRLGRTLDVGFVTDEVMAIGHSGSPIGDAAMMARTAITPRNLPATVSLDPRAVATSLRQLASQNVTPWDAQAWVRGGTFAWEGSNSGVGIDEPALADAIITHLTEPDAPANFQAGGAFVELKPRVSDKDAQAAISLAQKMLVDVNLEVSLTEVPASGAPASGAPASGASASPVPASKVPTSKAPASGASASGQTAGAPKSFTIPADTVVGWIVFGTQIDGTYGPSADPALMQSYLAGLSKQLRIDPVATTITYDKSGGPPTVQGGKDGADIDVAATAKAIAGYLDGLASGGSRVSKISALTTPVSPAVTADLMSRLVDIGSWTTTFYPDISNGNGANIRTPAKLLNGQVVNPGQQFSFLQAVGPIDSAHGYTMGGVIKGGKSDHTGAMGGGICSASTTMFNAAARAGLQIDERHAHFYYIYRYPVGLDATVYSDGTSTWDLKWTNDTPNPILIRGYSTYGSKSTITIELWSKPIDRKVTFTPEFKANIVQPGDSTVYVTNLAPGQQNRAEYPTIGFVTSRTRTVTDSSGKVIHTDKWDSSYTKVDGILQIGRART
jgi:vancomycin resistance protein YoaR